MEDKPVAQDHHIAPTLYDSMGRPYAEAPFTLVEDTRRYIHHGVKDKVIPVIFVPGIMGSNLKLKKPIQNYDSLKGFGKKAWRPDDVFTFLLKKFANLDPAERRRVLDPDNTEVDVDGDINDCGMAHFNKFDGDVQKNWRAEFKRRGWGAVMLSSYGELLCDLEYYLNRIYFDGNVHSHWRDNLLNISPHVKFWGATNGFVPLNVDHLKKAYEYWYPVHGFGYNWLRSNEESGKALANQIDFIISHYDTRLGYQCEKIILVTHSMGGLVARAACHPAIGNRADKVLGIVHGVMPANGAAAAYKRQHAGFEGASSLVLGATGAEVTAVFSNSPGALQLLPNKSYGVNWLKVVDSVGRELLSLPKSDPYQEIYRERNKWWRLMNPYWLDPVPNMTIGMKTINENWKIYLDNLTLAEEFHSKLAEYYHPKSYVHYGADLKYPAWGKVVWRERGSWMRNDDEKISLVKDGIVQTADGLGSVMIKPPTGKPESYDYWDTGAVVGRNWTAQLMPSSEPGDGTVPYASGAAPFRHVPFSSLMTGFDHQGSYKDGAVKRVTLYSIVRIAQDGP